MRQELKKFQSKRRFPAQQPKGEAVLDRAVSSRPVHCLDHPGYRIFGPSRPASPVIVAVPHAGRNYPASLLEQAAVKREVLERLEDRYADRLAEGLVAAGHVVIVARPPRAWIDYNRDEADLDPGMVTGLPFGQPLRPSAKLRAGLGLVPRRLSGPGAGELWRGPFAWSDIKARIEGAHRPYHQAIADALAKARATFGQALLFDLHSMPPLSATLGRSAPGIVLGDRFGRSCGSRLMTFAASYFEGRGFDTAQNHPYAGSYTLDRHGRLDRGVHALQCEVDRSLYLDASLREPGEGLAEMQAHIAALCAMLSDLLTPESFAEAAE